MHLSVPRPVTCVARKENSSVLLSSIRRNSDQFFGMALDGSTRLRTPFPLLDRVPALRLSATYSSHTTSTLWTCSCDIMYGKNTSFAYSEKVLAAPGLSMLTTAAPSKMTTCTLGLAAVSCNGTRSSRQLTKSDLVQLLSMPICDNAGGHTWFSCSKNSRFPSRI